MADTFGVDRRCTVSVEMIDEKTGRGTNLGEAVEFSTQCFTTDTPEGPRYAGWRVCCTTSLEPNDLGLYGPPEVFTSADTVVLVWRGDPDQKFTVVQKMTLQNPYESRCYAFVGAWIDTVRVLPGKPTEVSFLAPERRA